MLSNNDYNPNHTEDNHTITPKDFEEIHLLGEVYKAQNVIKKTWREAYEKMSRYMVFARALEDMIVGISFDTSSKELTAGS